MKKNIKLIALDMDGTILDDHGKFTKKTVTKFKALIDQGIHLVFATGRPHKSAENVMKDMGLSLPIISHNGSKIVVPGEGELYNHKISLEDTRILIDYAEKNKVDNMAYIDDIMYIKNPNEFAQSFAKEHRIQCKVIGDMVRNIPGSVNMVLFLYPEPVRDNHEEIFKDLEVSITRSMPQVSEFMAKGSNKGAALKVLAKHLGVKQDEILAAGNALNDLEMLQYAGTGIAMKNSDLKLLDVWDHVSEFTNHEEGVYQIIKDLEES